MSETDDYLVALRVTVTRDRIRQHPSPPECGVPDVLGEQIARHIAAEAQRRQAIPLDQIRYLHPVAAALAAISAVQFDQAMLVSQSDDPYPEPF